MYEITEKNINGIVEFNKKKRILTKRQTHIEYLLYVLCIIES